MKNLRILSIETTCDDTGISFLECNPKRIKILFNFLLSQDKLHQKYGGIVPHLAGQQHKKNLRKGLEKIMNKLKIKSLNKVFDYFVFANCPGLMPCLIAGKEFVQLLSILTKKSIIPVNHIQAHIYSPFISAEPNSTSYFRIRQIKFPIICITVSGGHTRLILIEDYFKEKILGRSLDDSAGEALDKASRMLKLDSLGGSALEKAAKSGNPKKFNFPRPMTKTVNYDFSFSGLKTALLYQIKKMKSWEKEKNNLAASFQKAVIDTLIEKTTRAVIEYKAESVFLTGGVSKNKALQEELRNVLKKFSKTKLFFAPQGLRSDNAVMIGFLGYLKLWKKEESVSKNWDEIEVRAKDMCE